MLPTLLGVGLTLAGCGDNPTQPDAGAVQPRPTAELAVASNSWLTRRDMPYERWALATAVVQTAAGHSILYATADILPAA